MAELLVVHAPWPLLATALALFGIGTAVSVPPTIATILEQVPAETSSTASGLLNALRQSGGVLGVAAANAALSLEPRLPIALWIIAIISSVTYILAVLVVIIQRRVIGRSSLPGNG
ncbi:TPA: hypothetical protein MFB66_004644 [Klebsiella pneumoniae]|uniref:hypothetical protein n=1 Tax=Enterobacterales TaxID=91347 RepID=UPI001083B500|nr:MULTISPECIES: hypothetical protein [Klebsiella]HBM3091626.1 hypothetical protein [Klebsiella michiganensis]EKV1235867.1 hypothetical protein [Klebsiella pneumoniae]EKY0627797.1 hypothetical protein [Klebsiella pneumoniae]EKY0644035.1 hypothetical protein [Klebsiella pneumoniae]EKY0655369.1 hypothetical protein [Klebsiella pneumoniae]